MIPQEKTTRIWICSWNMGAKNHFKLRTLNDGSKVVDESEIDQFEQFVPTNYDLYVFGIQEGIDDIFFNLLDKYLRRYNVYRLPLSPKDSCVHGRGDGSFLSTKYTGIAIYIHKKKKQFIQYKKCAAISAGITQGSKGAACVVLKIYSSTIAFLSTHMSSNRPEDKLVHFKLLMEKCGSKLGCHNFDLKEQFHHIIWFGDLNYRITDSTAEQVLMDMAMGNLEQLWVIDTLNEELRLNRTFSGFIEPNHRLDFYPTYKKKTDRVLDFDETPMHIRQMNVSAKERYLGLLDKIYRTKYKEPIYKGGLVKDRVPSFCDRILIHSLKSTNGQLIPEKDNGVLNCVQDTFVDYGCDNYGAIPHYLRGSDHSAIYCGLTLRSPILLPCPPNETADNGSPLCYQLKILRLMIIRTIGRNNTICEIPLKSKFCFPAPYELEHNYFPGPESTEILKQDFDIYHNIKCQIANDSQRRLSFEKCEPKNILEASLSKYHQQKPSDDWGHIPPYSMMNGVNKKRKTTISKSNSKLLVSIHKHHKRRKRRASANKNKSIDRERNITPSTKKYRKKSHIQVGDHYQRVHASSKKSISETVKTIVNGHRNIRRYPPPTEPPPTKKEIPEIEPVFSAPATLIFSSKLMSDAKENNTNGTEHHIPHTLKNIALPPLPSSSIPLVSLTDVDADEFEMQPLGVIQRSRSNVTFARNPIHSQSHSTEYFTDGKSIIPSSSPKVRKRETYFNEEEYECVSGKAVKHMSVSLSLTDVQQNNNTVGEQMSRTDEEMDVKTDEDFKHTVIHDEYFDEDRHGNKSKKRIAKIRSKSKRKNTSRETISDSLHEPMMRRSRSKSLTSFQEIFGEHVKLSASTERLYQAASEQAQKLALTSYGPNRRPSHGYIHCCIRVKTAEIEGQTTIPFKWSDFARGECGTKEASLTHCGLPLYDEESGKIIKIVLEYKCLLVEKK